MASGSPSTRTASVSVVETAQGTHSFKIVNYSLHKKLGVVDRCFCSATFAVGGHNWRIRYYDVVESLNNMYAFDSVLLELVAGSGKPVEEEVRAIYKFRTVNPVTGASYCRDISWPEAFSSENPRQGFTSFVRKDELLKYMDDDCLVIECDVTVIKDLQIKKTADDTSDDFDIQVPPSDLTQDLGRLLESEEEADVTFEVGGEVFHAHKIVLAMRSPVFKAELYGPMMRDKGAEISRRVEGMDPPVFRALLHFIYTDSFPPMDDLDDDEHQHMVKHLLVAADRYGMERMKLICESILCKSLDAGSVAYTLALASQHHCSKLKNACIEHIISSDGMDAVLASQGYEHLKAACPDVAVELWEKTAKCRGMTRSSSTSSKSTSDVMYLVDGPAASLRRSLGIS